MFYNVDVVKNGYTVRKSLSNSYDEDIYIFLQLDDALAWIKTDAVGKA